MTLRITEFWLLHVRDWRLLPWYDSGPCSRGCCFHREFSWLFLFVRVARITPRN